jgi:hypothetical protein
VARRGVWRDETTGLASCAVWMSRDVGLDEAGAHGAQFATFGAPAHPVLTRHHLQEARMTTIATLDARRLSVATTGRSSFEPFRC